MAKKLNTQQKAKRLLITAAMDMTRIKGKMRRACMLVLADEYNLSDAARAVGRGRQNVHRAVSKVKPKLAEVELAMGATQ